METELSITATITPTGLWLQLLDPKQLTEVHMISTAKEVNGTSTTRAPRTSTMVTTNSEEVHALWEFATPKEDTVSSKMLM